MQRHRQDLREAQQRADNSERNFLQKITSLEVRREAVRADLLKWMFICWLGNLGGIGAILFLLARHSLLR